MTGPFDDTRDQPAGRGVDPAWDPAVRRQVTDTVAALYRVLDDVLYRRRDPQTGEWRPTTGVFGRGDITGLSRAILCEVVDPIRDALDQVSGAIGSAVAAVDAHRRAEYGPGYQVDRSTWPPPGEDSRGNRRGGTAA